jgi:hypothetical protein
VLGAERIMEEAPSELFRKERREGGVERLHHGHLDARGSHELELARRCADERRGVGGCQHLGGVRLEGEDHRLASALACDLPLDREDVRVSQVDAIEVADCHHRVAEAAQGR